MRIKLNVDETLDETTVEINTPCINEEVLEIQRKLLSDGYKDIEIKATKFDKEYFLPLKEILFIETDGRNLAIHTRSDIYENKRRLRDLEEILPMDFIRVSKSTIINLTQIISVQRNLTGSSEVAFKGTNKVAFVSRSYFKVFMDRLEERRLTI